MLILKVFDETSFPIDLEGTVHTAVVVVFMLHLLVLLKVAFLGGGVGAEITVVPDSLMYTPCMAQKTSLVCRDSFPVKSKETTGMRRPVKSTC